MAAVDRLLNLTAALLDSARPLSLEEIRTKVPGYDQGNEESSRRMFERDKRDLIEMGLDITFVDGGEGASGYTATRADVLDAIDLTPVELAALHLAATSVVLDGVDEDQVTAGIQKLGGTLGGTGRPMAEIPMPEVLAELFDAVLHRRVASFDYLSVDRASAERREIEPHRLEFERGNWYVSGHDRVRGEGRSFRVDRVRGAVELGEPEEFAAPDRPKSVSVRPWELGSEDPVVASVRIGRELVPSFLGLAGDAPVVEVGADGAQVVELTVTHSAGLFSVLCDLLDGAELVGPPDLRSRFVAHLGALAEVDR